HISPLSLHDALPISCTPLQHIFSNGLFAQRFSCKHNRLIGGLQSGAPAFPLFRFGGGGGGDRQLYPLITAFIVTIPPDAPIVGRSEEHTSELQSREK